MKSKSLRRCKSGGLHSLRKMHSKVGKSKWITVKIILLRDMKNVISEYLSQFMNTHSPHTYTHTHTHTHTHIYIYIYMNERVLYLSQCKNSQNDLGFWIPCSIGNWRSHREFDTCKFYHFRIIQKIHFSNTVTTEPSGWQYVDVIDENLIFFFLHTGRLHFISTVFIIFTAEHIQWGWLNLWIGDRWNNNRRWVTYTKMSAKHLKRKYDLDIRIT